MTFFFDQQTSTRRNIFGLRRVEVNSLFAYYSLLICGFLRNPGSGCPFSEHCLSWSAEPVPAAAPEPVAAAVPERKLSEQCVPEWLPVQRSCCWKMRSFLHLPALCGIRSLRPVAITVIFAVSVTESSYIAPKIMFASSPASSCT